MPTISGSFPIVDGGEVNLQVWIGDAQLGRSSAAMNGEELASGESINQSLGAGDALRGRVLVVVSEIKDVRAETNWTSASVRLKSGTTTREFKQAQPVKADSKISYVFIITFSGADDV